MLPLLFFLVALGVLSSLPSLLIAGLGVGGFLVAAVGYIDDHRSLPAKVRLLMHVIAAVLFVAAVGRTGSVVRETAADWAVLILVVMGVVWATNLFNFMDGIDGIAASQALFVTGATATLIASQANTAVAADFAFLLSATAGACMGFLVWNWPPARIFMGDVGSGFLGFWIGSLAVTLHVLGVLSIWISLLLSSLFVADATTTLIRRFLRGERWYQAHRSHAYQILARRWNSHL
ncbi:MAG: glycosyltransferase family 4 protein, partial [FCB group bacterium]|nr:glycosyltransferase family 4 protein [FCB group bacterium]